MILAGKDMYSRWAEFIILLINTRNGKAAIDVPQGSVSDREGVIVVSVSVAERSQWKWLRARSPRKRTRVTSRAADRGPTYITDNLWIPIAA